MLIIQASRTMPDIATLDNRTQRLDVIQTGIFQVNSYLSFAS